MGAISRFFSAIKKKAKQAAAWLATQLLYFSISLNSPLLSKIFIWFGADVDANVEPFLEPGYSTRGNGLNLIAHTVLSGSTAVQRVLIDAGANVSQPITGNYSTYTALNIAINNLDVESVANLINAGATVNPITPITSSPLYSLRDRHFDYLQRGNGANDLPAMKQIFKMLIDAGAKPDASYASSILGGYVWNTISIIDGFFTMVVNSGAEANENALNYLFDVIHTKFVRKAIPDGIEPEAVPVDVDVARELLSRLPEASLEDVCNKFFSRFTKINGEERSKLLLFISTQKPKKPSTATVEPLDPTITWDSERRVLRKHSQGS